jgi:Flp pilus assembly protein TadD
MTIPVCPEHDVDDLLRLIERDLPDNEEVRSEWERAAHLMLQDKHLTAEGILISLADRCDSPAIWNTLVICYINLRDEDAAKYAIFQALEIHEDSLATILLWGILWSLSEMPYVSTGQYQRAVDIYPDEPFPRRLLAKALIRSGEYSRAHEHLVKLSQLTPDDEWVMEALGISFVQFDDEALAERELTRLTQIHKHSGGLWSGLGNVLFRRGKFEEAEKALRRALELDPECSQARFYLGLVFRMTGRSEAAARSFRKAVTLDPAYYHAWMNLGITLTDLGRVREAEQAFGSAHDASPHEYDATITQMRDVLRLQGVNI